MIRYQGLFFDRKTKHALQRLAQSLSGQDLFHKAIDEVHVTYQFNPGEAEWFHADELGEEQTIQITGFGSDEENIAFEVRVDDPRYKGAPVPHITMFLKTDRAKARNSRSLSFTPIPPFSVTGVLGFCTTHGVITGRKKATAV